jgi:NAD(P)-dependent dehydrogenase (short-subunit alcohol dehydrogenase family)
MTNSASDAPVWFVTGCSTGLGREFVRAALKRGYRAVATARDPKAIADLVKGHDGQAIALQLDVADPKEIAAAVKQAERVFRRIDVLVNNAGYGYMSAVEEGEDAAIRAQFHPPKLSRGLTGVKGIPYQRQNRPEAQWVWRTSSVRHLESVRS